MTKVEEIKIFSDGSTREENIARLILEPAMNSVTVIKRLHNCAEGDIELNGLTKELGSQINRTVKGNLRRPESFLIAQAHTLDALFSNLCHRSLMNMGKGEYMQAAETYMRLALKAQNQCQATLRTLGELKNPKNVAFVKQANIANNQQINNSATKDADQTRAQKKKRQQNELLEKEDGEWLDTGTKATASEIDKELETVEAINRPQNLTR